MKLLMCPPLYYRQRPEERERALSQWQRLYRLLRDQLEVDVDLLEPKPNLPGLVHVGRGGFVVGDNFIVSRFPDVARELESEPLENFFLVRGYDIERFENEVQFEGNRDITAYNGTLFTGFHPGDALCAHEEIEDILGSEVVGLELAHHWQYPRLRTREYLRSLLSRCIRFGHTDLCTSFIGAPSRASAWHGRV